MYRSWATSAQWNRKPVQSAFPFQQSDGWLDRCWSKRKKKDTMPTNEYNIILNPHILTTTSPHYDDRDLIIIRMKPTPKQPWYDDDQAGPGHTCIRQPAVQDETHVYPGGHARARTLTGHVVPLRPHKPGKIWIECTFPCGPPRPIRRGKAGSHPSIQGRGACTGGLANRCPHRRD